jgi:hypothetical protein
LLLKKQGVAPKFLVTDTMDDVVRLIEQREDLRSGTLLVS